MMTRETIIIMSEDGKRIVGKSFVIEDDNEKEETSEQISKEFVQQLAEFSGINAKTYQHKKIDSKNRLKRVERRLENEKRKNVKLERKREFIKKISTFLIIVFTLTGFIGGITFGIQIVNAYGPVKTVVATVITTLLYVAVGIVFASFLNYVTKKILINILRKYKEAIQENNSFIKDLSFNKRIAEKQYRAFHEQASARKPTT